MAKSSKPKKVKEVVEEIPATPDVIQETKVEEPVIETSVEPEVEDVVIPEPEKLKEEPKPEPIKVVQENLSMEDEICNFLSDFGQGRFIRMNDFLKSLFPVKKFNEPADWLTHNSSKQLRMLLSKMQTEGKIQISNNKHLKLGTQYYEGAEQVTSHHNLNTVIIEGKKI